MALELDGFNDPQLDEDYLAHLIDRVAPALAVRFGRFWNYFRNELASPVGVAADALNFCSRPYTQGQEVGLPPRITGIVRGSRGEQLTDSRRKEVVIENDIAWRIGTMIDYLFGRPPVFRSLAADANLAETISRALGATLDANGGVALLQEMALLGSVYGYVDVALRIPADAPPAATPADASPQHLPAAQAAHRPGTSQPSGDLAVAVASRLGLEPIDATRIVPILDDNDCRAIRYWVQCYRKHPAHLTGARRPWLGLGRPQGGTPAQVQCVEIISATWWQRYEDRRLAAEGPNMLGRLPVVHVQNIALPASYEGLGDVECLIPLQDELNTRLCDRASRVTYQSFKMYLGKGIDGFLERPVGPGQMWATHNMDATIQEFGRDEGSPSEDSHIEQVRSALDKVSGVTPLAAGLIRGNVGYLTSASALRVLLSGLLAKTARKRLTYGRGLQQLAELVLAYLDRTGVLPTAPADRRIEIIWPDPLADITPAAPASPA
jgi:hypothetical protein